MKKGYSLFLNYLTGSALSVRLCEHIYLVYSMGGTIIHACSCWVIPLHVHMQRRKLISSTCAGHGKQIHSESV